jgi:flagellar assembly protein FliH
MPAAPQKYTFDLEFDGSDSAGVQAVRPRRMYTLDEYEQAKAQAYAEGERSVAARAQADAARAAEEIARLCAQAMGSLAKVAHDHREASAGLALAAGRKIADAALDKFPEAPVAAALAELAREIEAKPVLKVEVAAHLVEPVRAALKGAAEACGYPGSITVSDAPGAARAAFTLDWGEGGAAFDPDAAAARVAAALEAALAAEGLHAESLTPESEADDE